MERAFIQLMGTAMKSNCGVFVLALLAGSFGCKGKPPAPPTLVVGHVASLSGPDKRAGLQASQGIRLALDELNKDAEVRIEVRHTDTRGNLDTFESQAVRLVALSQVKALLGGDTPEQVLRLDRAVQPDTADQPMFVPIVSPCGWRTRPMGKQVFLTGMTPEAQARVLVRHALEELHVTKVSLLVYQTNERARIVAEAVVREFAEVMRKKQPGLEPARPATLFYGNDVKLTDLLTRIGADSPQAVFLAGSAAQLRLVNEKLSEASAKLNRPPPVLLYAGADGSLRPDDWPMVTQKGAGVIYLASAFGLDKSHEPAEEFAQRFRKQFQEEPEVHAALAYEGMKLLADALRRGPDLAKARDELFKCKDFPGLAGPLHFDADQVLARPLFVLRLDRNKLVVMKKYAP